MPVGVVLLAAAFEAELNVVVGMREAGLIRVAVDVLHGVFQRVIQVVVDFDLVHIRQREGDYFN